MFYVLLVDIIDKEIDTMVVKTSEVGLDVHDATPVWAVPGDGKGTWLRDPMHFPRPLSPLFQTTFGPAFEPGFTTALRELCAPIAGISIGFQNSYYYDRYEPLVPRDDAHAREIAETAERIGQREVGRLMERWEGEHLPRIQAGLDRLRAMNPETATAAEAMALIDEVRAILTEEWLIHFRVVVPMFAAMGIYDELYADLFGGADADAHALLVGQSTKSVEAGIGLSDLAAEARRAGLDRLILDTPVEELMTELAATETGRAYATKIQTYLDAYGLRQDLFEFMTPTWQEDPTIALATVRAYLQSGHDARAEHERSVRNAEEAITAAREQLAVYPEPVRGQFEALLQAARAAYFLQEQHNFYIDQQGLARIRLVFLGFGRRFVAQDVIDRAEDIFLLETDEVKAIAAGPIGADRDVDVRALVDARRYEQERAARLTPPPFLGEPPAGPPPANSPVDRALLKFFGGPPQQAEASNQLKGNAGSRGTARGVARVALTLDEAKALQPGEILITITTMPAWTPLFGAAAAVVTETGGSLSHCAIVAREYGIPAVVGAYGATSAIKTGDLVTVDGDRGIVTLGI